LAEGPIRPLVGYDQFDRAVIGAEREHRALAVETGSFPGRCGTSKRFVDSDDNER
jgi:hypothetical protein